MPSIAIGLISLVLAYSLTTAATSPIRFACIGNSITAGAYPGKLATRLGPSYQLENDGVSGTTLMKKGDKPYWTMGKLANVFAFKPDVITIKLGTNDSKSQNWGPHKATFGPDLAALVDTLSRISTKPKIWLCLPSPSFSTGTGINGTIIRDEIIPIIKQVAAAKGLDIIDINTPLSNHPELFPDQVHPNDAGADSIAAIIFRTIEAKSIRIACIGNSITQYVGTVSGTTLPGEAYAARLGMLYGRGHFVNNYGVSGAYAQKSGPSPYWTNGRLGQVLAWKPQIITIKLGTNDSRAQYWNRANYIKDLSAMVDTLHRISPKPRIWLVLPVPAWKRNGLDPFNGISGVTIRDQVIPAIKEVAVAKGLSTIDAHTPFTTLERLVPDGVHPVAEGQDTLGHIFYRTMTANPTSIASAGPEIRAAYAEHLRKDRLRRVRGLMRFSWFSSQRGADGRAIRN